MRKNKIKKESNNKVDTTRKKPVYSYEMNLTQSNY